MEIIDVIPLKRGIGKEVLSYFSNQHVPLGAMVEIPLRRKKETALVVAKHDPKKLKTYLKSSNYQLKNIKDVRDDTLFSSAFIKTAVHMKNYYVSTTGSVLTAYTPTALLHDTVSHPLSPKDKEIGKNLMPEKYILQKEWPERLEYYKTYVRESFAMRESIFIMVPTRAEGEIVHQALAEYNKEHTYFIHSEYSAQQQRRLYNEINSAAHPVVVIGTPLFLLFPREDIGTIIVEGEASPYYKKQNRPFTDDRDMAYVYAHIKNCKYIAADTLVQLTTLRQRDDSVLQDASPLSFRMKHMSTPTLITPPDEKVDKPSKKKQQQQSAIERVLYTETKQYLDAWVNEEKPFCLFVPRKGLAPVTTCNDCGTVISNPNTGTPLVLRKETQKEHHYYQDPYTRESFEVTDVCDNCGGWRLETLGLGTEGVTDFLKKNYKQLTIETINADTTPTYAKSKKALDNAIEHNGCIVATEKILPLLGYKALSYVAIPSLASLFSRPTYTLYEDIMRVLLSLGESASEQFIIQTKDKHNTILETLSKQNLVDWYQNEMGERKEFGYPPYSVLIKISINTSKSTMYKKQERLEKLLSGYTIVIDTEKHKTKKGYKVIATLKIPSQQWIPKTGPRHGLSDTYKDLFNRLQALPQQYAVEINPRSFM